MSFPNVLPAISIFGKTHKAFDTTQTIVDREPVNTPGADYNVYGPIQPTTSKELEILPEGDRTKSAKTLHTKSELFIPEPGQNKQTFLRYKGKVWRVAAEGDWDDQGFRRYVAVRYKER
jgi:hypothetical protein